MKSAVVEWCRTVFVVTVFWSDFEKNGLKMLLVQIDGHLAQNYLGAFLWAPLSGQRATLFDICPNTNGHISITFAPSLFLLALLSIILLFRHFFFLSRLRFNCYPPYFINNKLLQRNEVSQIWCAKCIAVSSYVCSFVSLLCRLTLFAFVRFLLLFLFFLL